MDIANDEKYDQIRFVSDTLYETQHIYYILFRKSNNFFFDRPKTTVSSYK